MNWKLRVQKSTFSIEISEWNSGEFSGQNNGIESPPRQRLLVYVLACGEMIRVSSCECENELVRKSNLYLDASLRRLSYETQINPLHFISKVHINQWFLKLPSSAERSSAGNPHTYRPRNESPLSQKGKA